MLSLRSSTRLICGLLLLSGSGCKKKVTAPLAPPPLALREAAQARADLVAEVTLPNPQKTLTTVGAMAKTLGLPFGDTDLRNMLVAKSELPAAVVDKIDLTKPTSMIVLAPPTGTAVPDAGPKQEPRPVLAFALKAPNRAGFDAFVASAGKVSQSERDAVRVVAADGGSSPLWLIPREGAVCAGDSKEALVAACGLAFEARRTRSEDLRVVLIPEGLARASGTTLKAALDKARQELAAQQTQARAMAPKGADPRFQMAATQMTERLVGYIFDGVADTTEARLAFSLDESKGFTQLTEVVPRAGSAFSKLISTRRPYELDPAFVGGPAPGGLWAVGDSRIWSELFKAIREPMLSTIEKEQDRTRLGASVDTVLAALDGPWSARFSMAPGAKLDMQYDLVYRLDAGTDGAKLLASFEEMLNGPMITRLLEGTSNGLMSAKVTAKREGPQLVTRMAFDTKRLPPQTRAELKNMPFMDGKPIEGRAVVMGDRLLMTTGGDAKARLAALSKAAEAAPAGDLAQALADTKGEDGFYYTDLSALVRPALAGAASAAQANGAGQGMAAMMGAVSAMLANAHLGTWGSHRGGETLTFTWRVPMATFQSVSTLVRGFMGMAAGGGRPAQ